ncbi:MAG: type II toxin-antitoxin system HicB family antitoxin [Bacteroidetes bacterium]|nr:type II toxin-antitoxin system HicB family antitoxin [Bacteroidota bacterium]
MRKYDITIAVCIEEDENGFYAYAPALKGLHVGGSTIDEVVANAKDAVKLYLNSLSAHGEPFPEGPHLKIQNYSDPVTIEIPVSCPSPIKLGEKSKTSQHAISYVH